MATWTIRDVPDELDMEVTQFAQLHHRSKSKEIIALVSEAVHQTPKRRAINIDRVRAIAERSAASIGQNMNLNVEDLLYDEHGLPR